MPNALWRDAKRNLIAVLILFGGHGLHAQSEHKPVAPISPPELLKLLPAPPKGWDLTVSNGRNSFSTWLTTMAIREFKYTPPLRPGSSLDAPENLPQMTRYVISDGGYGPSLGAAFKDFKIGKEQGVEKVMLMGVPAMRFDAKQGEPQRLVFWVEGRFLVTIETTNQESAKIELWAKQLNFSRLVALAESSVGFLSNPVTITHVDEINKAKNRTHQLYWSYADE